MDTELNASVATFRVYTAGKGRPHGPARTDAGHRRAQAPPTRAERMAATPVTEGPLILSRLATNEMSYLQVNNFTRAVMPRSHIWRVSDAELVVPASFTNFWLITLSGPRHAVLKLDQILRCLCKYEVIGEDLDEEEEEVQTEAAHTDAGADGAGTPARAAVKTGTETAATGAEAVAEKVAKTAVGKDAPVQRVNTPSAEPALSPANSTGPQPAGRRGSSPGVRPATIPTSPKLPTAGAGGEDADARLSVRPLRPPAHKNRSQTELGPPALASPPVSPPLSPKLAPPYTLPAAARSDPSLHRNLKGQTPAKRELARPARLITPPEVENMQLAECRKTELRRADSAPAQPKRSDSVSSMDSLDFSLRALGSPVDDTSGEQPHELNGQLAPRSLPVLPKPLESHFGPRFSHPLIPSSHITRAYPIMTAPPAPPQRLSLQRRELLAVGPNNLHQDVTTVGGYIGLMAVNKFLRKT